MGVLLSGLQKRYSDGTQAVRDLNLSIASGEFFSLLGPSGCGKTTTLRMIAGLEEPTAGRIQINERDVTGIDPGDRDVAMVFQSYALYPHMTARENLILNLQAQKVARDEIDARLSEVARLLGLEELLQKKPGQLSGGQRQRVALGRAIIRRPAVFLMDEPLSNLDLKLREQMRTELKRLHRRLGITTVYVTHDQVEALTLSDRIAVMRGGDVQQIGTPSEIFGRPANLFVAEFIGSPGINLLKATADQNGLKIGPWPFPNLQVTFSREIIVGIRPEDIVLVEPESTALRGVVEFLEPVGSTIYVFVRLEKPEGAIQGNDRIVVGLNARYPIDAGDRVGLNLMVDRMRLFDPTGPALRDNEWTIREQQLANHWRIFPPR
jgi:ABC-type sugar transport system ATPase subunit